MKKFVMAFLILTFAVVVGFIAGNILKIKVSTDTNEKAVTPESTNLSEGKGFVWGVQGGAYALNNPDDPYQPLDVDIQIAKAKELGVGLIRANLEVKKELAPFKLTFQDKTNDDYVNRVTDAGLDFLMVLDPNIPETVGKADYYSEGYKMAAHASARYKGKVKYYQIANEISGTIVKKETTKGAVIKGENGIDYSEEMYDATLAWIKGMSKGIRENDPDAKIVLSGHWILYDLFPKLIADGADFDILGWSWYSSDGTDPTKREYNYGSSMNLAEKLFAIKKDVWIVETNADKGSLFEKMNESKGEEAQARFFKDFLPNVYNSPYLKGLVVFTLFDNGAAKLLDHDQDAHLGLVSIKINERDVSAGSNKKAFDEFKRYIANHK